MLDWEHNNVLIGPNKKYIKIQFGVQKIMC